MNQIQFPNTVRQSVKANQPIYKLVEGGKKVMVELPDGKLKMYKVYNISENGVLCDDLETYITWERFQ